MAQAATNTDCSSSQTKFGFQDVYPHGIQLSDDTIQVMETKSKNREAITFDEVTLEDKPSDFHPNDVKYVLRKVRSIYPLQIDFLDNQKSFS